MLSEIVNDKESRKTAEKADNHKNYLDKFEYIKSIKD